MKAYVQCLEAGTWTSRALQPRMRICSHDHHVHRPHQLIGTASRGKIVLDHAIISIAQSLPYGLHGSEERERVDRCQYHLANHPFSLLTCIGPVLAII